MASKYFLGGRWYRFYSRLAHRFNWHHTVTTRPGTTDVQDWCQWCGLRSIRIDGKSLVSLKMQTPPPGDNDKEK